MGFDGNCHSTDAAARESQRRQLRCVLVTLTAATAEGLEPFAIAHPEAQDIADAGKKRSALLSRCSPATFHLVKVLMAPAHLKDIPFETILASLRDHLAPKLPELARRCEVHRCDQAPSECHRLPRCPSNHGAALQHQ
ncbi:hypothetical protein HPB52_023505 [Rhipicephalus sanguineus]|uniref:Uncharacterized protein n=1 Tax=Rhipicephalus sanguineus TaxID=34632 RepID=A0A9D4TC40_RHISA|nr:hypothetical protein HPB52_023505 [Rhipicephalus sanguineus]